jgi:uncharacterized MAPEG superfamily protein
MKRRMRTFANDLENIPFHTGLFCAAFIVQNFCNLTGHGQVENMALMVLIVLYCFFRLAYTFCYIFALQPFRSIVFLLANLTVGIACCVMVSAAFKVDTGKFV